MAIRSAPSSGWLQDTTVTPAQGKRFYAIARDSGYTHEGVMRLLHTYGYEHWTDIGQEDYENLCQKARSRRLAKKWSGKD